MKLAKILCLLFTSIALIRCSSFQKTTQNSLSEFSEVDLFGASIFIQTHSDLLTKEIKDYIARNRTLWTNSLDPNCYYSRISKEMCATLDFDKDLRARAYEVAGAINKVSGGNFNTYDKKKKAQDFGGLCQGLINDVLRKAFDYPVFLNFAGDLFISPNFPLENPVSISNPASEKSTAANWIVHHASGWIITSAYSKEYREQKSNRKPTWSQVTLFGRESMDGAVVDALATSVILGDREYIARLLSKDSPYFHDLGALVFDTSFHPKCFGMIDCDFDSRQIEAKW